jgi:hypothetical protein
LRFFKKKYIPAAMNRPRSMPGNRPANTAPAENLLDEDRTGTTLTGLLVSVAEGVGDVVNVAVAVAVAVLDVTAVVEGAAFVEFSIAQILDWHS